MLELCTLGHGPLLKHRNIVNLQRIGWAVRSLDPMVISPVLYIERAPHGSLSEFEKSGAVVDHQARKGLCRDVCRGLSALHSCGIVHGDIKAENVLIFGDSSKGYVAKLSDFGCSIILDTYRHMGANEEVRLPGLSPPWNAPEAVDAVPKSQLPFTDVYSLGLLVWRILVFGDPFAVFDLPLRSDLRKVQILEILHLQHFPALIVRFVMDQNPDVDEIQSVTYTAVFSIALAINPM
jgi:serine/threonine protein kinase